MTDVTDRRLTSYAHGGGCACKISPGELEQLVAGLLVTPPASTGPATSGPACSSAWTTATTPRSPS